jgi:hypothetical protein
MQHERQLLRAFFFALEHRTHHAAAWTGHKVIAVPLQASHHRREATQ